MRFRGLFSIGALVTLAASAQAEETTGPLEIGAGTGYAWTQADSGDSQGVQFDAAFFFPGLERGKERLSLSVLHAFGNDPVSRTDLAVTYLRYWGEVIGTGVLGGVEYLDPDRASASYLKPVFGLQLEGRAFRREGFEAWVFLQYRVARGGTGTLAFDGGPSAYSARIWALGIAWRTAILE